MVLALNDFLFEPEEDWRNQAACSGSNNDLFFPVGDDEEVVAPAKAICAVCPVRDECLQYAIATNQTEGVWGGLSAPERRRLRRRIRDRQRRAS